MRNATERPILCYVTGGHEFPADQRQRILIERIRVAVNAGVDWVQIREKDLASKAILTLAREAVQLAAASRNHTRILVNDRVDVALAAGAAGVHLGADALPVDAVATWRRGGKFPHGFSIGASCHSVEDAQRAELAGADYVFFGPVFQTPAKIMFGPPQGLSRLEEVCRAVKVPVLSVGGITEEDVPECLHAGAEGVAAIRLFQEPREADGFKALVSRLHALR